MSSGSGALTGAAAGVTAATGRGGTSRGPSPAHGRAFSGVDAIVTDPDAPLPVAIARMAQAGTARLLVMHGDRLVGLLTTNGVIRRLKVREELAG